MTAWRGSNGGDLGDTRNAADAEEDAAEASDAGQGEDEPRLRAMRAVWLAMRDEAPPDRGLAELLAAARRKAEDMAEAMQPKPTLWQRLLAAMRRPPVLALATALVLIGGAAIIGRRAVDPTSRPESVAGEQVAGSREAAPSKLGAGASTMPAGPGSAVGPPPPTAAARGELPPATPAVLGSSGSSAAAEPAGSRPAAREEATPGPAVHTARPARGAIDRPAPTRMEAAVDQRPAPSVPAAPSAPSTPRSKEDVGGDGEAGVRDIREKSTERVLRGSPSPPPRALHRAAGSSGSENEGPAVTDSSAASPGAGDSTGEAPGEAKPARPRDQQPRSTLAQLYKQCESAASRRDCAAVRRIVDQITPADRGYRDRIAKDSPVAKCLAE